MPTIECLKGAATTPIGSDTYVFSKDRYGRFTAQVENLRHVAILVGLPAYQEVEKDPVPDDAPGIDAGATDELAAQLKQALADIGTRDTKIAELEASVSTLTLQLETAKNEISSLQVLLDEATAPADDADGKGATATGQTDSSKGEVIPENLSLIAGLGDPSQTKLASKGIVSFAQLAALTPEEMAALDKELKLGGASERNDWIGQAKAIIAEQAAAKAAEQS